MKTEQYELKLSRRSIRTVYVHRFGNVERKEDKPTDIDMQRFGTLQKMAEQYKNKNGKKHID